MYKGPGAQMPLTSAVAAIAGVSLVFARLVVVFVRLTASNVSSPMTFSS